MRAPIRIRTFLVVTLLALLVLPALGAGAAWLVESHRQQSEIHHRVNAAVAYLSTHRASPGNRAVVQGFARLLDRLDLLAQVVLVTDAPPGKHPLYTSPVLAKGETPAQIKERRAGRPSLQAPQAPAPWIQTDHAIAAGSPKARGVLIADIYYLHASRTTRALVALLSGTIVLLVGLAVALWLAGRWMAGPLTRLSAQVDKVAGGDLTIEIPGSRIAEIENIAQAVDGMTEALGESAQRRAEAEESRRFLVSSVAHDLRTPLFALRGHLQAIRSQVGDPDLHLERAEARAGALERLIGNLFAYTRDDFAQPLPQLEAAPVAALLGEVVDGLEHTAHFRHASVRLDGDAELAAIVDPDRFRRALTNILDNALRYSPPGAAIDVAWRAEGDSLVEIVVQDHGPGIDADLLPHIFEPGIRGAPPPGDDDAGTGLGLAIARRLLEHQNATIAVDNNGGATFRLTLRRASAEPA